MAYEKSPFGDGSDAGSGNVTYAVSNHYGPRTTGKSNGVIGTEGAMNELTLHLDGKVVSDEEFALYVKPFLPAYCRIEDVYLEVEEVFVLGGTSPVVNVGTDGSETTNGIEITESQLETVGVYDLTSTLAGTWAAAGGITAETTLGIVMDGTSPTSDETAGKAKVVIRYVKV